MTQQSKISRIFDEKCDDVYVISEIGINHNGDLQTALQLIEESKRAGVDGVKFQKRNLESIYAREILNNPNTAEWNFDYMLPLLREVELGYDDYQTISSRCKALDLELIITPFDMRSADFIAELDIQAVKISSADMTNTELVQHCSSFDKPLLISTGMWEDKDIATCVEVFRKNIPTYALLLTQSTYPAPYESLQLGYLETLKKYSDIVGYSGHERGIFIPIAAIAMGCRIIEKHITLDRNQKGPDHKASLLPSEFREMVSNIRCLEQALGSTKSPTVAEQLNKELFAKSAVAVTDLPRGHLLQKTDIQFKSPGKGIHPHQIHTYYGKPLVVPVSKGKHLSSTDFEKTLAIKDWKQFTFSKQWGVKCRFHDFDQYAQVNSPVIEFHVSETDLDQSFNGASPEHALIVHAPEIFNRKLIDLCSEDAQHVRKSLAVLQKTIDKTMELSSNFPKAKPKIVMHLGGMSMEEKSRPGREKMLQRALSNLKFLEYDPTKVDILPENLPPRPWYLGGEWFQYAFVEEEDFISLFEQAGLQMTFDLCHAALFCTYKKKKLADYIRAVRHIIGHIHISDARGINGEGVQVEEGDINFPVALDSLNGHQFSWVPEIWSGHLQNGKGVYKALCRLEKFNHIL